MMAALAVVVDAVASAALWPRLPEVVPVHWGFDGQPDRFGSKLELVVAGPVVLVGLWVLLVVLRRVDPRAAAPMPADAPPAEAGTRDAVVAVVMGLLALGHLGLLLQVSGATSAGPLLLGITACAFQLVAGNLLPRVRPNFFVGVRTPWTLSSDQVWRRTHRLAGRLLVASGLLSTLALAVLPAGWVVSVVVGLLLAASLIPVGASYFYWKGAPR
jgi:uncharacterized membrane protein